MEPTTPLSTLVARHRRRAFAAAVRSGDLTRIGDLVAAGVPIDARDGDGNTALHLAYRDGRLDVVARLRALGAAPTARNAHGLIPPDMRELARVESMLHRGARLVEAAGGWTDAATARALYDYLSTAHLGIYVVGLGRTGTAAGPDHRRRIVALAVRIGRTGSEDALSRLLDDRATAAMAEQLLTSGHARLHRAARAWAARHGYTVHPDARPTTASWGSFD